MRLLGSGKENACYHRVWGCYVNIRGVEERMDVTIGFKSAKGEEGRAGI